MNYEKIIIFVSDGVYGVHGGAGMSNNRFLKCLVELGYGKKLIICPVYISKNNPNFNEVWFSKTKDFLNKSGAKIIPIQDGTLGEYLHGSSLTRKIASRNSYNQVKHVSKIFKTLVISFDTTFIELLKYLNNLTNITHIHIPRSTALHQNPDDEERVDYEKECFKYADGNNTFIGVTGEFMRRHLMNDYLIPCEKLINITNGVLLDEYTPINPNKIADIFRNNNLDNNKKFIFSYGRANYYKGFHLLIKALGKINVSVRPQLVLIATTSDDDSKYVKYLKELWNKNSINGLLLTKFDDRLPRVLQQSENLLSVVVPSIAEPFGLIPIEIFANKYCKAPVISSNIGGLKHQVINGITGFVFKNKSIKELAAKINSIYLLTEEQRDSIKLNSLKLVKDKFNYLKNVRIFMEKVNNLTV